MREIKTACITQTLRFSNHDGETTEYAKKAIVQECKKYKAQMEKSGTEYRILSINLVSRWNELCKNNTNITYMKTYFLRYC